MVAFLQEGGKIPDPQMELKIVSSRVNELSEDKRGVYNEFHQVQQPSHLTFEVPVSVLKVKRVDCSLMCCLR